MPGASTKPARKPVYYQATMSIGALMALESLLDHVSKHTKDGLSDDLVTAYRALKQARQVNLGT